MRFGHLAGALRATPAILCILAVLSTTRALGRPNVLFIAIDDMNDWVGFLDGHPQVQTPNMDRLARRGVVFSNAHCAAPLCGPSRAAVFTGRQPYRTGVVNNEHQIRKLHPDLVLLPQHFHAHGYRTLGAGKLMHRNFTDLYDETYFPEQRWSPYADKEPQSPQQPLRLAMRPLNGMPNDRQRLQPGRFSSFDWGAVDVPDTEMGDGKVAHWAAKRLREQTDSQQSLFLAVGFYRPHIPLYAPREYFDLYPVKSTVVPDVPSDDLSDVGSEAVALAHSIDTAGLHENVVRYDQWKDAVAGYLACISFVDAQIGVVLDALDQGPYADSTMIVLWSDHGWHLGEKEHWGKSTGWERSTRVPLVIVPAKADAARCKVGRRCDAPVGLIDLFPTLIEMCDLTPKSELDGVSLVAQLADPAVKTDRSVITTVSDRLFSVRDSRWRLIRYADGSQELYDHQNDPQEWKNLVDDGRFAAVKQRLVQSLPAE